MHLKKFILIILGFPVFGGMKILNYACTIL